MPDKHSNVRLVEEAGIPARAKVDEALIAGVEVVLEARLGSATMTVAELMALKGGDCLPLDAAMNQFVELRLNGITVAHGELVAVGDCFGVRIAEIAAR